MDIYCLEDTHTNMITESAFKKDWGANCIFSSFNTSSRGVAILLSENLDVNFKQICKDDNGNLLMVNLKIANTLELILAVLYGPNKDDPNFYENLKDSLKHNEELLLIICGDWNLVQNYSLDTFWVCSAEQQKLIPYCGRA